MQGINKAKHVHLVDALFQLEQLLSKEFECLQQTRTYSMELEKMHKDYEKQLANLSVLIAEYETLFSEIKNQFLGKKLRELKKEIPTEKPAFVKLLENIRLAYGT